MICFRHRGVLAAKSTPDAGIFGGGLYLATLNLEL